ncbi:hypothetical protein Pd630_LPD00965 [Rhodococcus opacus PD630]|nr:hypothetical protein Pd630_LPD00965 [Rhodococcus opacus PD630]EJI96738.1 hypothetical protein JVH1_5804 [Rhodococcus sp. JVH1]
MLQTEGRLPHQGQALVDCVEGHGSISVRVKGAFEFTFY